MQPKMEVESRKRPHTGEEDRVQTKKRVLTTTNGGPHVNGAELEDPMGFHNLELFRKEAIFRRMRQYSRENERSQGQVAELESRILTYEAGLAALSACWTQLVEAIRLLVRAKDLPPIDIKTKEMFDLATHTSPDAQPNLKKVMQENSEATRQLVSKFVQLSGPNNFPPSRDEMYAKAQKAQTQCIALHSELNIMRVESQHTAAEIDSLRTALRSAEGRVDRLQSKTIQAMESKTPAVKQEVKQEESDESHPVQPSPPEPPTERGSTPNLKELEMLQDRIKAQVAEITDIARENAELREQKIALALGLKHAPPAALSENPHYVLLVEHVSRLEHISKDYPDEIKRLREELDQLHHSRKDFEDDLTASKAQACQELKASLTKRDVDNARLRETRDQHAAELLERKQKDCIKTGSLEEFKALAEFRSERMAGLSSEIAALKARLAAQAGEEDLMMFLLGDESGSASYVKDLEAKLRSSQDRVSSLEQSISVLEGGHPDAVKCLKAEAEARRQLSEAKRELGRYQSTFGDLSALSADVRTLSQQLLQKEDEIKRLRLLDTQRGQAETTLYAEIDRLSAAWNSLESKVRSKVFDLSEMEERLNKLGQEKAKTENKYYAAMRAKEAVDVERKAQSRHVEKQGKAIERLVDSERNLIAQVGDLEKEVVQWKKRAESGESRAEKLDHENIELRHVRAIVDFHTERSRVVHQEHEKQMERKRADFRICEDALLRYKREAEASTAKLQNLADSTLTSHKETELEHEAGKLMALLKCSTCKMRMRNTIITKCMHTFCKECVETRLTLRNRKCPYCNLTFAQSDVQAIFFQ